MSGFNGSGTYVRPFSWVNDKANAIVITASRFDTDGNTVAGALSNCICKDGQQTTTALIPFAAGISVNQGLVATPSITVAGDTDTGFYQTTTGELRFGSNGTNAATLNANGLDNTAVGVGTPAAGHFTTLSASGAINKITLTQPATSATITIVDGKTLKVDNTLELAGTDSTKMTFPGTSDTVVTLAATQTLTNKTLTSPIVGTQTDGDNSTKAASTAYVAAAITPAITKLTSGSGTYTVPAGTTFLKVTMIGGGGGGGSSGTGGGSGGANGGSTTFGTTLLSAGGGTLGVTNGASGGAGGTSSLGSGPAGLALTGGYGSPSTAYTGGGVTAGGNGGSSAFGGAGSGGGGTSPVATAGITNTGGGGGGGGSGGTFNGTGGGAGGYVQAWITTLLASYSYAVGAGGAGMTNSGGGCDGAAGGSGVILIEAY